MADGGAAGPTSRRPRLDVDTWTVQLEELLALQSVYEDDIRWGGVGLVGRWDGGLDGEEVGEVGGGGEGCN